MSPNNQKRIGVLGGTFDPLHIGHLLLASEAMDQLNLEKVLWVLTPFPPHKKGVEISPLEIRKQLLTSALENEDNFELSYIDIERPEPHYAVDTVKKLKQLYASYEVIYLMGGDSFRDLPNWYDPRGFVNACDKIAVMRRPGSDYDLEKLDTVMQGVKNKACFLDSPLLFISSSEIRKRIILNRPYKWLMPESVFQIIQKNQYYK